MTHTLADLHHDLHRTAMDRRDFFRLAFDPAETPACQAEYYRCWELAKRRTEAIQEELAQARLARRG
jgi:hypothetical protein